MNLALDKRNYVGQPNHFQPNNVLNTMKQFNNTLSISIFSEYTQALIRLVDILKLGEVDENSEQEKSILYQQIETYQTKNR